MEEKSHDYVGQSTNGIEVLFSFGFSFFGFGTIRLKCRTISIAACATVI
jgi:hypothetical protein